MDSSMAAFVLRSETACRAINPNDPRSTVRLRRYIQREFEPDGLYPRMDLAARETGRPERFVGRTPLGDGRLAESELLAHTTLYWASAECIDLWEPAARTIPDDTTLSPELVPNMAGLVMLQRPILGIDEDTWTRIIPLAAMQWNVIVNASNGMPSIRYRWFITSDPGVMVPAWIPQSANNWDHGEPLAYGTGVLGESITEDRRLLATFWGLTKSPGILTMAAVSAPRQERRAAERAAVDSPEVVVVTIRRDQRDRQPSTGDGGKLSVRHTVSGHWRQQACGPQRSMRRPVWINPHWRGPLDAPVKAAPEVVHAWRHARPREGATP